jgi:hypothetical protein
VLEGSQADTYSERESRASHLERDSQQRHAPLLSPKSLDGENELGYLDERDYEEGRAGSLHSESKIEFDYIEKADEDIYVDTVISCDKLGASHRTVNRELSNLSYTEAARGES